MESLNTLVKKEQLPLLEGIVIMNFIIEVLGVDAVFILLSILLKNCNKNGRVPKCLKGADLKSVRTG